jgi:hypothetical protein
VERLFPRRESSADAIDQKIVKSEGRDVRQESSTQKPCAGSHKSNTTALGIRDIEAQDTLSGRGAPRRTFEPGKVCPRKQDEESKTDVKKAWTKPHKNFTGRHACVQIQKVLGDAHANGQERNEYCKGNSQDDQIDHCGSKSQPESRGACCACDTAAGRSWFVWIHASENIISRFATEIACATSASAIQKERAAPLLARSAWYFGHRLFISPPV